MEVIMIGILLVTFNLIMWGAISFKPEQSLLRVPSMEGEGPKAIYMQECGRAERPKPKKLNYEDNIEGFYSFDTINTKGKEVDGDASRKGHVNTLEGIVAVYAHQDDPQTLLEFIYDERIYERRYPKFFTRLGLIRKAHEFSEHVVTNNKRGKIEK